MLQTVEAIINKNGEIKLLEKVDILKSSRAIVTILNEDIIGSNEEKTKEQREKEAHDWLMKCDEIAIENKHNFNSAEDIRQIREERTEQICPS